MNDLETSEIEIADYESGTQPDELPVKKKMPLKVTFDFNFKEFFASLFTVIIFLILPIWVISNWPEIQTSVNNAINPTQSGGRVAGIMTDNLPNHVYIPILNFQFDKSLREPATLSFLFGVILLVIAIIIITILFVDFRRNERKYR